VDRYPRSWRAYLPHHLPTPSIARPVRSLRRWSRSWARPPPLGSAVAPPQVEGGHRLAHAAVATKWRRGGSLPVLVGSALTLPLAHTIHSTPRAVPPAVVSVAGAHGAARKCGCTPQVEGGRRLAHVRLEKWLHRHGAHKTSIRAAPGHHTHRQIPCGNSTAARSTNGCCSQHFYVKSAVHKPIVPTALTHVVGGLWADVGRQLRAAAW
jgi:hypothetical protein